MPKKLIPLSLLFSLLLFSSLFAAEKQVRVIADKAPIYAENNIYSYRIDTVKKGTILIVFETGAPMEEWFYVRFHSQRWKNVVTGFIQAYMIEEITDKPKEEPKPKPQTIEPKPVEAPKKPEQPQISVEEVLVASSLLPSRLLPFPEIREKKEVPRVFMYDETRPPQKKMAVPQREQIKEDTLPKIEKLETKPAKVQPKEEHFVEIESVGVTFMPPSTQYALPKVEADKDSRVFISIERKPVATESSQKPVKTVSDIARKTPEKLEDRQPPQKTAEEAPKKEEPAAKKPEQKQVVPQIVTERPPRPKISKPPTEFSLLTFSLGYGPSLGSGLGGFLQLNTKIGLSLHIGSGYYPTSYFYSEYDWVKNKVLYSAGIKYYLPFKSNTFRTYLDLQYGGISVEAVRLVTSIWYYQYVYKNIQKTLYGPSILAGIELKLGRIGLNGAIGLSYNTTDWDYWDRDYFLTADMGLLLYLW